MESRPATMAEASRAGATPPCCCLPEEIIIWEILTRLPPKSLIRCRAVCHAWRGATVSRDFLLAHHTCQPSLPIVWGASYYSRACYDDFLTFDHRAADGQLQLVARLDESYCPEVSCDGFLVLSKRGTTGTCFSLYNPVTREHSPLGTPWDFSIFSLLGMYLHRPTSEYRLLLHRWTTDRGSIVRSLLPKGEIGCYVFVLGLNQPPRYFGGPDVPAALRFDPPVLVCDSLHWFPVQQQRESSLMLVFDTTTESFRQMRAPVVPTKSSIFEMDGTLGIYSYNIDMQVVDIWVLQNYEREVWKYKYLVELPVAKIRGQFGLYDDHWDLSVLCGHRDILLLLSLGRWMFHVNTDGELVEKFHRHGEHIYAWDFCLKQTLVPHNFTSHEGYVLNASPFL